MSEPPRLDGWIILDKPVGLGSTQAVSAVKRALRTGGYPKVKVGHGGTLDPLASGVLPVALGEATKLAGRMLDADKGYDFTIRFGEETDTLDAEGTAVATSDGRPALSAIEAVLPRFTGAIVQTPPAFSALMIDGTRAYDRARAGESFEVAARAVTVKELYLPGSGRGTAAAGGGGEAPSPSESSAARAFRQPSDDPLSRTEAPCEAITLSALVSKGTYIRSLARDIARALGTVGHVVMLRRTKAGPFSLDHAISLDKLDQAARAQALEDLCLPLTAGLDGIPALDLTPDQAGALLQGRKLFGIAAQTGLHLARLGTIPVALVEADGPALRVVRGFNLMPREDA